MNERIRLDSPVEKLEGYFDIEGTIFYGNKEPKVEIGVMEINRTKSAR